MSTSTDPPTPGRRALLKGALATIGAGLGVVLLPEAAQAAGVTCCLDRSCPGSCSSGRQYRCINHCTQVGFCACYSGRPDCFSTVC